MNGLIPIKQNENISTLFSYFHDGSLNFLSQKNNALLLNVEIPYLAHRIDSSFKHFRITLENLKEIYFVPWKDATPDNIDDVESISNIEQIFAADLEVLKSHFTDSHIIVALHQFSPDIDYVGGELYIKTSSIVVQDETAKDYTLEEIKALSDGYWEEWRSGYQRNSLLHQSISKYLAKLPEGWYVSNSEKSRSLFEELQIELHSEHILYNKEVAVIAHREGTDDILCIHLAEPEHLTVVHLSYSGKMECLGYPTVEVDGTFEDFIKYENRFL